MKRISHNITDLIGNTPLLEVGSYMLRRGARATVVAKLEYFNPLGSVKDRVAYNMVVDAEERGLIREGATIIEPTSGNTGVGLAFVCSVKGYKLILTMPDTMSVERRRLLSALGAEIVLTPGAKGMAGSIEEAERLRDTTEGAVILQQFQNPANPQSHVGTTAEEIWRDTEGNVDVLVACVGTGGTICGTARGLKAHKPDVEIVAVEPSKSPLLSGGNAAPHGIQGIGANFIPQTYDATVVDKVLTVDDEEAFAVTRDLARCEGLLVGISSGAAMAAAMRLACDEAYKGKNIVVILPDTGERYLSTGIYDD
jgi:cysteine synthase A